MDLSVRCQAVGCDLPAVVSVRWQATVVVVCATHAAGQVTEVPVDAAVK